MTSQAILADNMPQIANQTKSNVSKNDNIIGRDRDSFQRVMNNSQTEQINYRTRNTDMDRVQVDKSYMDKAVNDKRAEIASKLQSHMAKNNSQPIVDEGSHSQAKPFVKEEFVEDVKDVINSIADAYTEALDIEDEELINIMEQLGINLFQLPLEDIVKEIVLNANGESDITGLLVNEDAFASLNKLKEFFANFNPEEKLDMSLEDYSSLVQEAIDRLTILDGEVSDNQLTENAGLENNLNSENLNFDNNIETEELDVEIKVVDTEKETNNAIDNVLDMNANVEDKSLEKLVIQDDSKVVDNSNFSNEQSNKSDELVQNKDNTHMTNVKDESVSFKSEIEINENKKISVEIVKDVNVTPNQENQDKNVKLDFNNQINEQNKGVIEQQLSTQELSTDDLNLIDADTDTLDTKTQDTDKGINNKDVNEYISQRKDSLVADKTSQDSTSDMMSEGKNTNQSMTDSAKEINNKEAAVEFYDKFIANLENSLGVGEGEMLNEMSHVREMREVVEQLVDKIKVNINKDTTTLKMQLAPEHLGKLELEISSKSGVLTANIKVENAVAKEAIENGLQTLIQKFDEQGVKVEAVEVSIANYDMSKENGREKSSQDYEIDMKKKRKHGKISLEDLNAMEAEENTNNQESRIPSMTATTIDYAV